MAIDLPPPMPPQQVEVKTISSVSPIASGKVGDYEVRVSGADLISADQIKLVLSQSDNPSQAVVAVGGAYQAEGHLLVRMRYALDGKTLYVNARQAELADIETPPALAGYFDPLVGDPDLKSAEFERYRILANIKAERAGEKVSVGYRLDESNPDRVVMVLTSETDPEHKPTEFTVQVGNPGNRFLGRYFSQMSARHQTRYGTEVAAGWETALTSIGSSPRGGKDYDRFQVVLDQPTRYGLYGFDISHTDYTQEVQVDIDLDGDLESIDLDAEISEVGLNGRQILFSKERSRLNLYERIEHIESEIVASAAGGLLLLDEPHTTFEGGVTYHRLVRLMNRDLRLTLDGAVETGLSGDHGTLGTLATPGVVAPGRRTAEFVLVKPKLGLTMPVADRYTFGFDLLGQYSDGDQVPQQQQWVLGGMGSLSAYLPGTLVGDTGYFARLYLERSALDMSFIKLAPSIFLEGGSAEFEDASGNAGDRRSVVDAGIKLASELGAGFSLEVIAAVPLSDSNLDSDFLEENESDAFFRLRKVF